MQLGAMQQQSSSQRVGALLIHRPASVDQHTDRSRLTPTVHETDIDKDQACENPTIALRQDESENPT